MKIISIPDRVVTKPRVVDDPEQQLSTTRSCARTSLQSTGHPTPRSPQTQLSEPIQDVLSSETQPRERASRDPVTSTQSNRRSREASPVRMSASSTGTDYMNSVAIAFQQYHEETCSSKSPHALRKKQLQKNLDSLISPGSSALLLCSGEEDYCRIISAQIRDSANSTAQWNEAQSTWNQHKMKWRSWLPWYGLKSVAVVRVRLYPLIQDSNPPVPANRGSGPNSR